MPCRPTRQGTSEEVELEVEPEVEVKLEIDVEVDSVDRGTMNRAYTVSPRLLYLTSYSRYHGEDPNMTSAAVRGDSASYR